MPDVFDEISTEPKADVFDEIAPDDDGPSIRATPLTTRIRRRIEDFAPSILSTQGSVLSPETPRGLIPATIKALSTSPLQEIPRIPRKEGDSIPKQIGAGAVDTVQGTAEFLTSPLGLGTIATAGIGPLASRLVAGAFTPIVAKQAYDKISEGLKNKDWRAGTEGLLLAGMGGLGAKHAVTGKSKPSMADLEKIVDDTIPKATPEPVQPKEPVTDIFDEVAAEPVASAEPAPVSVEQKVEAPIEQPAIAAEAPPEKVEAVVEPEPVVKPIATQLESINRSPRVKLTTPEGATSVRGTDAKGRTSVQPIATIAKGNPFHGADIVKLEAGTIDKTGKFKAMEGDVEVKPISVGPGAESVGEIAPSNLAQLTSAITRLADEVPETSPAKAFDFGDTLSGVKDSASSALDGLRAAGQYIAKKFEGKPVWTEMKEAVGDRHLALSESVHNARKFTDRALKEVPDKELQEAISNWVDTGGDEAKLGAAAVESKGKYKAGYERALRLTPEQKLFAQNLKNYFEARLEEAQKAAILEDGIENYIHRIYEADSGFKRGVLAELGSGLSTAKPGLAKQRVFEYDFEAEQAGLKPIKSFVKRVAAYDLALNKAIADRAAVKAMMEIKMPDGRPAIDVAGLGTKTIPDAEGASATLINPKWKPTDADTPAKFRGDYRAIDAPALRKWKWVSADENGNPTFVQGDVLVHPDAYKQVNALVGKSLIRSNPVGRFVLNAGAVIKDTMLDLSLFHLTQIGLHGFEHRSFKPVEKIDFTNPDVRGLVRGGMVVGETSGRAAFDEGGGGKSLVDKIPVLGEAATAFKDYLFQSYIPRLKISTGLHALERNRARYPNLSESELYHKTATQMNGAFGGLNYEMMARNKTTQDVFRLAALAPDFLEARGRFAADATTKYGREQLAALTYGAVTLYALARIINKLLNGQYHFEPENAFSVVYKGKSYGLRTVQGDIMHAATAPMHFIRNRLNPAITRPALEAVTGRDEFGRTRTAPQQAADYAKTLIPISFKGLVEGPEKTLFESLLNSTGMTVKRDSSDRRISQKIRDWKAKNKIYEGPGEFVYDPDKDQYRGIKISARNGDKDMVKSEVQALIKSGVSMRKILEYFREGSQRPLTGSRANDLKFKASLSPDEKKTFEEAKKERLKIYQMVRESAR